MYSGYVTIGNGKKHVHYWYTEAHTAPTEKPIVLWSNGGERSPGPPGLPARYSAALCPEANSRVRAPCLSRRPRVVLSHRHAHRARHVPARLPEPGRRQWLRPQADREPHRLGQARQYGEPVCGPLPRPRAPAAPATPSRSAPPRAAPQLFFEHPTPVGFSYCDDAEACSHSDQGAADDLYACIDAFFTVKFPELKGRPFFLTGESYAGIYLPMTALVIQQKADPKVINLQGVAHGDGCIGNEVGTCSNEGPRILADFLHGQNFISTELHGNIVRQCVNMDAPSAACEAYLNDMTNEAGDYFVYMIDSTCPSDHATGGRRASQGVIKSARDALVRDPVSGGIRLRDFVSTVSASHSTDASGRRVWSSDLRTSADTHAVVRSARAEMAAASGLSAGTQARPGTQQWYCGADAAMAAWLNDPAVQKAIHVTTDVPNFNFNYSRTEPNLLPRYPDLASNYRMLIYSGNADACVPTPGSEQWTSGLGFKKIDSWRPWLAPINGAVQAGGFVTVYEPKNFSFATLTLSGHMAPQFVGESAFALINRFLNGLAY